MELIKNELQAVENLILEACNSKIYSVEHLGQHVMAKSGKKLRPKIGILSALACGIQNKDHILFASCLELIHNATLLHDDVIDKATLRRGVVSANRIAGNTMSILVGDFLYSRALQLLMPLSHVQDLGTLLLRAVERIAEGEVVQLLYQYNTSLNEKDYIDIAKHKTGELFALAAVSGAMLSQTDYQDSLLEFGYCFGIAFQIMDDMLDYFSDKTGKKMGIDFLEGKTTLPLIYLLQRLNVSEKEKIANIMRLKQMTAYDWHYVQKLMHNKNVSELIYQKMMFYLKRAVQCLQVLPHSPYKEALIQLTQQSIHSYV